MKKQAALEEARVRGHGFQENYCDFFANLDCYDHVIKSTLAVNRCFPPHLGVFVLLYFCLFVLKHLI